MSMRDRAKVLVEKLGMRVFPLRPRDKRPLPGTRGFKDASDNLAQLDRWYLAHPAANIGLPTGADNQIVVLDFDYRHWPGREEQVDTDGVVHERDPWEMVEEFFEGKVPDTWVVETPSGGFHLYFKHPGELIPNSAGKLAPGVDVRGDGGYVCAPPSIHPNGHEYLWARKPNEVELAEVPTTLLSKLKSAKKQAIDAEMKGTLDDGKIPSGSRNETLTSLAGSMQRRGMAPDAILVALLAQNKATCDPPLDEWEIQNIAASVARYEPDPEAKIETVAKKNRKLELVSVADMIAEPPPIEWILPGRLARGDCALMVGPPGCGKSWLTMDLAISGALGEPIFGEIRLAPELPFLKVLYVDEENPKDELNRRMHLIYQGQRLNGGRNRRALDLETRLFVTDACQGFTFKEKGGYIESLTELVQQLEPDLIVFDSLTAVSGIEDENRATEVREFFHEKLYPLRRLNNAAILCVHHTNKRAYETEGNETMVTDGQIRGSGDYLGVVDACLFASAVKNESTGKVVKRRLKQTKVRRDSEPDALTWDLVSTNESGHKGLRPKIVADMVGDSKVKGKDRAVEDLAARLTKKQ
jgi:KaiC/GvpD/RAD55 family RecA-like ATPase